MLRAFGAAQFVGELFGVAGGFAGFLPNFLFGLGRGVIGLAERSGEIADRFFEIVRGSVEFSGELVERRGLGVLRRGLRIVAALLQRLLSCSQRRGLLRRSLRNLARLVAGLAHLFGQLTAFSLQLFPRAFGQAAGAFKRIGRLPFMLGFRV